MRDVSRAQGAKNRARHVDGGRWAIEHAFFLSKQSNAPSLLLPVDASALAAVAGERLRLDQVLLDVGREKDGRLRAETEGREGEEEVEQGKDETAAEGGEEEESLRLGRRPIAAAPPLPRASAPRIAAFSCFPARARRVERNEKPFSFD